MLFRALPLLSKSRNVWAGRLGSKHGSHLQMACSAIPQHMLPVRERTPVEDASLTDIVTFYHAAQQLIAQVGDSLQQSDGGPSAKELQKELDWLLEDCVAAVADNSAAISDPNCTASALAWRPAGWRELQRQMPQQLPANGANQQQGTPTLVQLRAPLQKIGEMWQARVLQRQPLQYLTAAAFFREFVLAVGPGVLIPRPETEQLIELALDVQKQMHEQLLGMPWADLGTGSGAIACGMASACPHIAQVYAIDTSADALQWAQVNVHRLGLQNRVRCLEGDLFGPLQALEVRQKLAGIISNPPYIPSDDLPGLQVEDDLPGLQAEVGKYEPQLALDGGPGPGTDILTRIFRGALQFLAPAGALLLETNGGTQAQQLCADMLVYSTELQFSGSQIPVKASYASAQVHDDMFGVPRFVVATVQHVDCQ